MTSVYAGHLTTGEHAPRDENGAPITNASFILYELGTTTPPIYYSDRLKSDTVSGPPTTDDKGNVDGWVEPGIYDYWFDGEFIQTVTVEEDNSEDDVALAAAESTINTTFGDYYTKAEIDNLLLGVGNVVGAELQANKNQANGYAGLNGSGLVANAQLPTTATTSTRTPSAHASTHQVGGSDVVSVFGKTTTREISAPTTVTAVAGDAIAYNIDAASGTINLPAPSANAPIITVRILNSDPTANAANISGTIDGFVDTYSLAYPEISVSFFSSATSWYKFGSAAAADAIVTAGAALSGFNGAVISGYCANVVPVTGTSGSVSGSFNLYVCSNAADTTMTLPKAGPLGAFHEFYQKSSAGQVHLVAESGATIVEPDGFSYTNKQRCVISARCVENPGSAAVWQVSGYTGANT